MTRTVIRTLAPAVLMMSVAIGGCGQGSNPVGELTDQMGNLFGGGNDDTQQPFDATSPDGSGTVLISTDAKSQLTIPSGWTNDEILHESAEIQAANPDKEMYVIVLAEAKDRVEGEGLERNSELYLELFKDNLLFDQPSEQVADMTEIKGNPAIQHEVTGVADNTSVMYVHTTVETSNQYYQILGWTRSSNYEEQKAELQAVIESFQEVTQQTDVETEATS